MPTANATVRRKIRTPPTHPAWLPNRQKSIRNNAKAGHIAARPTDWEPEVPAGRRSLRIEPAGGEIHAPLDPPTVGRTRRPQVHPETSGWLNFAAKPPSSEQELGSGPC
jgi:hypothetical protein